MAAVYGTCLVDTGGICHDPRDEPIQEDSMTTIQPTLRRLAPIAVTVVALVTSAACSGEDIAESIIENRLEAEGGGEVDLDLDGGNVRIETDEGVVEMQTDEDGNVSIQNDEGSMEMTSDEEGNLSIRTDEGSMELTQGSELPPNFPSSVPLPSGLSLEVSQVVESPEGTNFFLSGKVTGNGEEVAEAHIAALESAGYTQDVVSRSPGSVLYNYSNGESVVAGFVADDPSSPGVAVVTIQVGPSPG
jgi:hypothetical protein